MLQSAQIQERFVARRGTRMAVSVCFIVLSVIYLMWRASILNSGSLTISIVYYLAEVFGFLLGLTVLFSSWRFKHRVSPPAPSGRSVDVFVTAYKEPLHILRKTLRASIAIRYPHQTWLLDDGRRPELRALARELGARYVTRPVNTGAKAGNLNNALRQSTAEFVMVFDADHIPLPHAIDDLLGFFDRPAVAMAQAPQDYYNTDAFQYMNSRSGRLWHDQSFFYTIAQSCNDSHNGASCVGTSVMYRRSALDTIGGIPEATLTEDIHTSLKLHKSGFESVYLNEAVGYGVAAADLTEYYKTRHRWAHGNLHALRLEGVPFTRKMTLGQNLSYLTLGLIYLEGWQQFLLFFVPVASLLLGMPPFEISIFNVAVVMLFPVLTHLLLQELGCGLSRYWPNEVFSMARFPVHIVSTLGLFRARLLWRSSSKATKGRFSLALLSPQIAVCAASLFAVGYGVVRLLADFKTGPLIAAGTSMFQSVAFTLAGTGAAPAQISWFTVMNEGYTADLVVVAGFWALVNSARAAFVIAKAARNARRSHEFFRFDITVPAAVAAKSHGRATIRRLSEDWVEFDAGSAAGWTPGETVSAVIELPSCVLDAQLVVRAVAAHGKDVKRVEAAILPMSRHNADQLADTLYSCRLGARAKAEVPYFLTPLEVGQRLLSRLGLARKAKSSAAEKSVPAPAAAPAFVPAGKPHPSRAEVHQLEHPPAA